MNIFALTAYMLVWPIISAGILVLLVISLIRDIRNARKNGEKMI